MAARSVHPGGRLGIQLLSDFSLQDLSRSPRTKWRSRISSISTGGFGGIFGQLLGFLLLFILLLVSTPCYGVVAGSLQYYATRNSIGIEWQVSEDANHNSVCQVSYRQTGATSWQVAMPLYRVDFQGADMVAGSIFSLLPGTSYDVRLELSDVDGGNTTRDFSLVTLALPRAPEGGRTLYVVPGSGGGSGTAGDPFRGIAAAQANVTAGDTVLVGAGTYPGETELTVSGAEGNYIVWKARGNGTTILETIRVNGNHLWLEGLHVRGNAYGIRTYNDPRDVVVMKNTFLGCHYCVYLNHGGTAWYIADNTIVGDVDPASGVFDGEGIELNHSDHHSVLYNSISRVADGISYPGKNCDIFGNDIFDVSDDGIEPDYGYANIRVFGNRISNAYHNGISFQPMNGAPWYILRNQVAAPVESALKFRDAVDRALVAHNTFVGWQGAQKSGSEYLTAIQSNNNLWISMTDWYAWENGSGGSPDWRTNLDYDGFDWGRHVYAIKWGTRYSDLTAFAAATGLEQHGIRIDKSTCFEEINIPQSPPASMPLQYLRLKQDCAAVDAGIRLPNINDDYKGNAPDLGAYEVGAPLPHYGPRLSAPGKGSIVPSLVPLLFR